MRTLLCVGLGCGLQIIATLCAISCAGVTHDTSTIGGDAAPPGKADWGQVPDIDWANQFFITQIHDARWNPNGMESDSSSNNCGPASLAMLMSARDTLPTDLTPKMAIDHARALMYPGYPAIDASTLSGDATMYEEQGLVFVDDDTQPVYFDWVEDAASIPQGIEHGGGEPVFGYSWGELDTFLEDNGAVIAHGHITEDWRKRFDGEYGVTGEGSISHFIVLFPATTTDDVIVCDPMHKGGAVVMARSNLQTFFKSPVNVFETSIRLLAWEEGAESLPEEPPEIVPDAD